MNITFQCPLGSQTDTKLFLKSGYCARKRTNIVTNIQYIFGSILG